MDDFFPSLMTLGKRIFKWVFLNGQLSTETKKTKLFFFYKLSRNDV